MSEPAILRVDSNGFVLAVSTTAAELLGCRVGMRCSDAVRARGRGRDAVCTTQCHANLCAANDHGEVEVRGRHLTMSCTQVGDETIVTLTPCGDVHRWFEQLTKREAEVMRLVACGLQTANIAQTLKVSQSTVRTHVEHARDKLGATTRAEAVARALITGQITL